MDVTTNLVTNIYNVKCESCDFTGSISYKESKVKALNISSVIRFTNTACPQCGKTHLFSLSGRYVRNELTGHMKRIDDFEGASILEHV